MSIHAEQLHKSEHFTINYFKANRSISVAIHDMSGIGDKEMDEYCVAMRKAYKARGDAKLSFGVMYDLRALEITEDFFSLVNKKYKLMKQVEPIAKKYMYGAAILISSQSVADTITKIIDMFNFPKTCERLFTSDPKDWVRFMWEEFRKYKDKGQKQSLVQDKEEPGQLSPDLGARTSDDDSSAFSSGDSDY